jgi:hypothetical protein
MDGLAPLTPLNLPLVQARLGEAIDRLEDAARDQVLHQFFALGNRLIVADGRDPGDPSAHRSALEKAAGFLGIALEMRGVEADAASDVVTRVPLIELFREGWARAVELQRRSRTLTREGWAAGHPRALEMLDSPVRERLEALLEARPSYYEIGDDESAAGLRPFRSTADLDETAVAVEIAEVVGGLLVDRLGLDVRRALDEERPERAEPPRFSTFLLTFLAWHAARGELRGDPLTEDVTSDFLRTVASRRSAGPDAAARALDALVQHVQRTFDLEPRPTAVLVSFGRACLEQLSAECGALDPGIPVDPRFVSCLLIQAGDIPPGGVSPPR